MNIEFGPVQHLEEGTFHNILVNGTVIGGVFSDSGYAYLDEDSLREAVNKALQKRFGIQLGIFEIS